MIESDEYRDHAGVTQWPRSRDELTRTDLCPACFSTLSTSVCRSCGLDLDHPAAQELLAASMETANEFDRRLDIIGRIRFETGAQRSLEAAAERDRLQAQSDTADSTPTAPVTVVAPTNGLTSPDAAARRDASTSAPPISRNDALPSAPDLPAGRDAPPTQTMPPSADTPSRPPRRSSVQLVLLIVGVSLLSVGAIAFLVYAFVNYGIIWRSVIIGAVTVASFAVATILQRRSLRATAEGIAAFAVVLVYLDAYAIRANDLFGAASADGQVYWGAALVVASVGLIGWHRMADLRVPSIAGFLGFAPGVGILVGGLTREFDDLESGFLGFTAAALAGIIHRLAGRAAPASVLGHRGGVERATVLAVSVASLALAAGNGALVNLLRPDSDATRPVLALLAVAAVAAVHVGVLRSLPSRGADASRWSAAFAVILGLAASTLGVAIVGSGGFGRGGLLADSWQSTPVIVAAGTALLLEAAGRRLADAFLRSTARVGAWTAATIGALTLLIPLLVVATEFVIVLTGSIGSAWTVGFDERIADGSPDIDAVVGLAIVVVLAALIWRATGVLPRRAAVIGWAGSAVVVLAVPSLGSVGAMLAAWFVLAVAAVLTLRMTAPHRTGGMSTAVRPLRLPLVGVLAASTVAGWTVGWASTGTWAIAAVLTIAIAITARSLVETAAVRAALLGTASALLIYSAGAAARQIDLSTGLDIWTDDPIRSAGATAVILLGAAALLGARWLSALDRRTVFWITAFVAIASTLRMRLSSDTSAFLLADPAIAVVVDLLLVIAILLWIVPRVTAAFPLERGAASLALAPVVWIAADSIATALWRTESSIGAARWVAPVIAALVVGTVSLAVTIGRPDAAPSHDPPSWIDPTPTSFRDVGVVVVALAGVAGAIATDATTTWLTLLVAAVTLIVVRVAQADHGVSAALVGAAALLAIGAAATSAQVVPGSLDGARLAQLTAILLLVASAFPLRRVANAGDRRTVFWLTLGTVAVIEGALRVAGVLSLTIPSPMTELAAHIALLAGLLLWVALRGTAARRPERIAASIAVGPAVYLVVESFVLVVDVPEFARSVAPMTAALITAAGSLAVALLRPGSAGARPFREIGVSIVAFLALVGALSVDDPLGWLVFILAAVTVLLVSISDDGLVASRSNRRHIGWVAIALATAGLWLRLASDAITAVEPYVLPVAGILLMVALLTWRAARHRPASRDTAVSSPGGAPGDEIRADSSDRAGGPTIGSLASPLILLAGLLTAILPIAAYSVDGSLLRAIAIAAASAVLLLIGSLLDRDSSNARPYLDAVALAGGIGVLVTSIGRSAVLLREWPGSVELDAWILGGMTVLVIAAFGLASITDDAFRRQRRIAGQTLAVIALTGVLVVETTAIIRVDAGFIRPFGVVLLLSAVHVLAFLVDRPPFTRSVAWLSVGYALVVAAAGVAAGALDPLESGTVPIAVALIATGTVHLDRSPAARSWPWLGPGVILLLLPSLAATIDDRPLWRLVAIGVVGVAIVVIGVLRSLQAPFVIASVLVLVHAIATFAPQIRATYESVAWWLWLVIGGVILIALAARYEHRMKNLRNIAEKVGSLR